MPRIVEPVRKRLDGDGGRATGWWATKGWEADWQVLGGYHMEVDIRPVSGIQPHSAANWVVRLILSVN